MPAVPTNPRRTRRTRCALRLSSLALAAALPFPAFAQSFNIALGPVGSAPSPTYAAAGLAGVWNDVGLTAFGTRVPLVGLDGLATDAELRQVGATSALHSDDPATTGDDEALVDSMVWSLCNPLDACYWIDGLENGSYVVTLYGLTPNAPAILSSVRVDDATPGATPIGGAWPGAHVEGVSYKSFVVDVVDGEIGLHSGVPGSGAQAGLNGIQIRPATAVDVGSSLPPSRGTVRLAAFPNPASGAQIIEAVWGAAGAALDPAGGVLSLEIVDVLGRVVWRERLPAFTGGRAALNWAGVRSGGEPAAPGVYFARLAAETESPGGVGSAAAPESTPLKLVRSR